jgi:hypothetical protein
MHNKETTSSQFAIFKIMAALPATLAYRHKKHFRKGVCEGKTPFLYQPHLCLHNERNSQAEQIGRKQGGYSLIIIKLV